MDHVLEESHLSAECPLEKCVSRISTLSHTVAITASILVVLFFAAQGIYQSPKTHIPISIFTGLGGILTILYTRYVLRFRWISVPVMFLIQLWMYNFGLSFVSALVPSTPESFRPRDIEWLYRAETRMAMLMALLACLGFTLGTGLIMGRQSLRPTKSAIWRHEASLFTIGWFLMILGLFLAFLVIAMTGGLGVFSRSYMDFRETTLSSLFPAIQVSQVGCMLAICGAGGRRWLAPTIIWTLFGLMLLILGLRNEALTPLLCFIIILIYRGVKFKKPVIWSIVFVLLLFIPAIRVFRTVGFSRRGVTNWTEVTALETFVELGGSLRASHAYVNWIEQGDAYLYGAGYWAPFERHFLVWVLPIARTPLDLDQRVPGQFMHSREGAVGTSTVGEAYYNFGIFGPVIYFSAIGMLLGWLNRRAFFSQYRLAILGSVTMVVFWSIRDQFLAVPAQILASLLVIGFCYIFRNRYAS